MTKKYSFQQVDVFTNRPLMGNALAVVHGADNLSDKQMTKFANWTNLSETTFLLNPINDSADYKVRIFTPNNELPFAGHPTLGSCFAWLSNGGIAKSKDVIIQECAIGLIKIRKDGSRLSFEAPELIKSGSLDDLTLKKVAMSLRIGVSDIINHQWVDNGPGWCAVMLKNAQQVLALDPDPQLLKDFKIGVIGSYPDGSETDFEVRAFAMPYGIYEDPVTGSLNAGIAKWFFNTNSVKDEYTVSQGKALGRDGKIFIQKIDNTIWVGGEIISCINGELTL
jgi:PhzF family phenazine biosynthesis protein